MQLDYGLIRLLYTVLGMDKKAIAEALGVYQEVVTLVIQQDLKLTPRDQEPYKTLTTQERLRVFDAERIILFSSRYAVIESQLLDKVACCLQGMAEESITPKALRTLAAVVSTLRQPVYGKNEDVEQLCSAESAQSCEQRAREAIAKLDEMRAHRGGVQ